MSGGANAELVALGDLDELIRHIDRLCAAGEWEGLVDLRDRCRQALERGKQLWPAAAHVEYRLALEAPGRWAGGVLVPDAGQFAPGPLTEVAAQNHTWDELAPHIPSGPLATLVAHERVIHGEDLTGDPRVDPGVLELPLCLQPWEPTYPLAHYHPHGADFDGVAPPRLSPIQVPTSPPVSVEDLEACAALVELAASWTQESNGQARAVAVAGRLPDALAALGARRARVAEVSPRRALALMAWAGASGGAHGRRRGMATGRFAVWWGLTALAGLTERWPVPADRLGRAASELHWYCWDRGAPDTGWVLRLAVEDPAEGLSWAVSATDRA